MGKREGPTLRFSAEASLPSNRSAFTNSRSAGLMFANGSGEPGEENTQHSKKRSHREEWSPGA